MHIIKNISIIIIVIIRSTIEQECYDCKGDDDSWEGKILLWPDSSEDEDRQDEDDDYDTDHYKVWSEYDESHWACDTWEDVDTSSLPVKPVLNEEEEEDWGWGESDASHGSDWGSL